MDYNRYRRYFIILDNEDGGYTNKQGKNPKGYTKIEIKNGRAVLSHYVQNLKYFSNAEYMYRGYLIGTKDGKSIYADNGAFIIDESGKGELVWRFDPQNVDGKGSPIDAFNVIAIVAEASDVHLRGNSILAPLVGFIDKEKMEWKHVLEGRFMRKEKSQEEEEINQKYEKKYEEIKEILKNANPQPEVKEEIEIVEGEKAAPEEEFEIEINIHIEEEPEEVEIPLPKIEKKEEILKKEIEKKEELEETEEIEEIKEKIEKAEAKFEEQVEETAPLKQDSYQPSHEDIHYDDIGYDTMKYFNPQKPYPYYQDYQRMVSDYVNNILKYYKKVEPFEKNMEGCQWWKIDCNQQTLYRNFLPFYGYLSNMSYYYPQMHYMTGCPELIYKYQHYIFGKICDNGGEPTHYLYGIPGRYTISEQPYEGMTGFTYWHPIEDREPQRGDYGYWILHLDAKTGNVVMPLNPTPVPRY